MTLYYSDDHVQLHHGDCLDVLATLPDASVDAVVTDPPYGLANTTPAQVTDTLLRWVNGERDYLPSGRGFMGHEWDGFVPPVAVWDECLRVLKPGGHMAVFAGSRTQDLMGLAIRLAGFDLRDSVAWLYGSGFPKSHDVAKAIDRVNGEAGRLHKFTAWMRTTGVTARELDEITGTNMGGHYLTAASQPAIPTPELWVKIRPHVGDTPSWVDELVDRIEAERIITQAEARPPVPGEHITFDQRSSTERERRDIPATPEAERWQGWGTALKPGHEPIILARKPFPGTVAGNVLEWGTGALNIAGCRIGDEVRVNPSAANKPGGASLNLSAYGMPQDVDGRAASGRWPANVVLDETQARELDQQSGHSASVASVRKRAGTSAGNGETLNHYAINDDNTGGFNDQGGASRFFYTAKADSNERPRIDGIAHPTVKPLDLMRWLVRLVTPPGGTILDPFAGSGTTGEAALLEGFLSILIERETDYLPLIVQRIHRRLNPVEAIRQTGGDLGLFGEPT